MNIVIGLFLIVIGVLLCCMIKLLRRINNTMESAKRQLEEYLKVIWDSATEDDVQNYAVGNEEKQLLWTMEEKEQLFNEMLQEIFQ